MRDWLAPWVRGAIWRAVCLAATPVGWLIDRQWRSMHDACQPPEPVYDYHYEDRIGDR